MNADGSLEWDAPSGEWVVLRVGHVNTGAKNGPAPAEGTGFECDKLSEKGADAQFAGYVGRLTAKNGSLYKKLDSMLMDSWECRRQTWTEGFDKEFLKRCGYDVFTYMPALFGYVVDSPETTTRFLCDWRGLISDCIANRFYGRMAKLAHQQGLQIQFETSFGDVVPGDIMEYYKHADIPMCEFWQMPFGTVSETPSQRIRLTAPLISMRLAIVTFPTTAYQPVFIAAVALEIVVKFSQSSSLPAAFTYVMPTVLWKVAVNVRFPLAVKL